MSEPQTCLTCRFWDGRGDPYLVEHSTGNCRRHAPTTALIVRTQPEYGGTSPLWPTMRASGWCGDYAAEIAKENAEVSPPERLA